MNLPIPKSRSGIFASIFLTAILFFIYYAFLYDKAYDFYKGEYGKISFYSLATKPHLSINLWVPKYTSTVIPGWVYGSITNTGAKIDTVVVAINISNEEVLLVPSAFQSKELFQRGFTDDIFPSSTLNFRIPLHSPILKTDDFLFYLDGEKVTPQQDLSQTIQASVVRALRRAVIENLFLPPWLNTVIPILSLLLCYFSESKKVNTQEAAPVTLSSVFYILVFSLWLGSAFMFLVLFTLDETLWQLLASVALFVFWALTENTKAGSGNGTPWYKQITTPFRKAK